MTPPRHAGAGTPGDPWTLATPPGKATFQAHRAETEDPPALVVQVGSTELRYQGYRGRFGNYVPPVLEALGLAEVEHNPRNNRMRALSVSR